MRVWCASLLLGLLITLSLHSCKASPGVNSPKTCCFNYRTAKMRVGNIMKYEQTVSACLNPGVIFITYKDEHVCVEPHQSWVKKAMEVIDNRRLETDPSE